NRVFRRHLSLRKFKDFEGGENPGLLTVKLFHPAVCKFFSILSNGRGVRDLNFGVARRQFPAGSLPRSFPRFAESGYHPRLRSLSVPAVPSRSIAAAIGRDHSKSLQLRVQPVALKAVLRTVA